MVKAIARAFRWRKLLESGAYRTVEEIAAAEKINPSYVSRVLRLTLLAPNIVGANRIDAALFEACFLSWATALRPDAADLIALDGKTLRRSGDSAAGQPALQLVSAWASTQRLVLCQEAADTKENECAAMLAILERLSLKGALVTIDAIATNPTIARAIGAGDGDYVLALKQNQPSLHQEVETYFADPRTTGLETLVVSDKDHGRLETRTYWVSHEVDWLGGERRYPGEPRFPALKSLVKTTTRAERRGKVSEETRYFISSAPLSRVDGADGRDGQPPIRWLGLLPGSPQDTYPAVLRKHRGSRGSRSNIHARGRRSRRGHFLR